MMRVIIEREINPRPKKLEFLIGFCIVNYQKFYQYNVKMYIHFLPFTFCLPLYFFGGLVSERYYELSSDDEGSGGGLLPCSTSS